MELDELKSAWQSSETPVHTAFLQGIRAAKSESTFKQMKVGPIFEIAMCAIAAILLGNFCYENVSRPVYFGSGIALELGNILLLATNVQKLIALAAIDLAKPVVENQRNLTLVRRIAILQSKWILLASPLLWGLLMLVVPMGANVDLIRLLGVPYMLGNVLFGAVFVPAGLWIIGMTSPKFKQKLADEISGTSMKKASAYLDELRRFELDA